MSKKDLYGISRTVAFESVDAELKIPGARMTAILEKVSTRKQNAESQA